MTTLALDNSGFRELTFSEINVVSAGSHLKGHGAPNNADQVNHTTSGSAGAAFGIASTWVSTVAGGAVGAVVSNGLRGLVVGGAAGFLVGAAIGVGYYLATSD